MTIGHQLSLELDPTTKASPAAKRLPVRRMTVVPNEGRCPARRQPRLLRRVRQARAADHPPRPEDDLDPGRRARALGRPERGALERLTAAATARVAPGVRVCSPARDRRRAAP